jgi:hypothetical protein
MWLIEIVLIKNIWVEIIQQEVFLSRIFWRVCGEFHFDDISTG